MDISILVNNAGVMHNEFYINLSPKDIEGLINLNDLAPLLLFNVFISKIEAYSKKTGKKGAIINVDSIAGTGPAPFVAVYSGSKGYLRNLSLSVSEEVIE